MNNYPTTINYITLARTTSRPVKIDTILERRMEDFLQARLNALRTSFALDLSELA